MTSIRPITPCLWFDNQAEEAAQLYTGIFPDEEVRHCRTRAGLSRMSAR